MKKLLLTAFCFLQVGYSFAQYKVQFIVTDSAEKKQIYISGNFNNWNPGDSVYKLKPIDKTHQETTITLPHRGHYEYKFTRGTWGTVESTSAGIDISNRIMNVKKDTVIYVKIAGWIDDYKDISALPDSVRVVVLMTRSFYYQDRNIDSSYKYALETYKDAKKNGYQFWEGFSLLLMGDAMEHKGDILKALQFYLEGSEISEKLKDSFLLLNSWNGLGQVFLDEKDFPKAKLYYFKVINTHRNNGHDSAEKSYALIKLGTIYLNTGKLDSALLFAEKGNKTIDFSVRGNGIDAGTSLILLGDIRKEMGMDSLALQNYRKAVQYGYFMNNLTAVANGYQRIAEEFKEKNQLDSGFYYSKKAFDLARQIKNTQTIFDAGSLLVSFYKDKNQLDSAFIYQQVVLQAKDSLFNLDKQREIQSFVFNQQLDQQKVKARQAQYRSRVKMYALLGGLLALIIIAIILFRSSKHRQKLYSLLLKKKKEVEDTLADLKSTQKQLIQSEKMASLGELTAGIAHEIQNPLNFVNNFSEVNTELIDELKAERLKPKAERSEQVEDEIINDIAGNSEKIIHHGKRADAIVKGMLQHSRVSSGQREPTNINALADEYFRLSYHGMRAKDKSFNATMKTDFDESVGRINVVPQDIGRVLLNLFNNAFYAASQPSKGGLSEALPKREPTVWVSTKRLADVTSPSGRPSGAVEIRVKDNGNGIPEKIMDKIFQPFFTTKPTGEGTGLGLSLSYDMIKAHGGEIKVNSKEGEGTEFVVVLPA